MEIITEIYDMVTEKLEVKLNEHFEANEEDPNKRQEAKSFLTKNFAECRKEIDAYNNRIHFFDRIETMKKAMESYDENKIDANEEENTSKRTYRFFDDVESSVNSMGVQNKRDFAAKLTDIDAEYQRILARLMAELNRKNEDINNQI